MAFMMRRCIYIVLLLFGWILGADAQENSLAIPTDIVEIQDRIGFKLIASLDQVLLEPDRPRLCLMLRNGNSVSSFRVNLGTN